MPFLSSLNICTPTFLLKMSLNNDKENEIQIETEFNKLNISDNDSNIDHENCYNPYGRNKYWCKDCVPRIIIETIDSGNNDIDEFIKDTIYNAKSYSRHPLFLEWVPFQI